MRIIAATFFETGKPSWSVCHPPKYLWEILLVWDIWGDGWGRGMDCLLGTARWLVASEGVTKDDAHLCVVGNVCLE